MGPDGAPLVAEYYRRRARHYEDFYAIPEHAGDLFSIRQWLTEHSHRSRILEIAAGTGFWTRIVAVVAARIMATDINEQMLMISAQRCSSPNIVYAVADAYRLPVFQAGAFDLAMAHHWWSHVPKERQRDFLEGIAIGLRAGTKLLMIDQCYVAGFSGDQARVDGHGNRYEPRTLHDGTKFEIIKNYPSDTEIRAALSAFCSDIQIVRLRYFWALTGTLNHEANLSRG